LFYLIFTMASVYKSISKKAKKRQETNALDEINIVDDDMSSDDTSMDEIEDDEEEEMGSSNEQSAEEATNGVVLINSPKPKKSGNTNAATVSSKSHTQSQSDFLPKTRVLTLTSRGVTHRYLTFAS
jgi:ribosome biogenesis protein BRX1